MWWQWLICLLLEPVYVVESSGVGLKINISYHSTKNYLCACTEEYFFLFSRALLYICILIRKQCLNYFNLQAPVFSWQIYHPCWFHCTEPAEYWQCIFEMKTQSRGLFSSVVAKEHLKRVSSLSFSGNKVKPVKENKCLQTPEPQSQ